MSLYLLLPMIAIGTGFMVLVVRTVYCNVKNMNVAIENNKEVLHFYDLATTPYYEGDEENPQAFADLLDYLHKKNLGRKCRLSKEARDRYVPVTTKSTIVLSMLSVWEVAKTVMLLLLAFGGLTAILALAGTPL